MPDERCVDESTNKRALGRLLFVQINLRYIILLLSNGFNASLVPKFLKGINFKLNDLPVQSFILYVFLLSDVR